MKIFPESQKLIGRIAQSMKEKPKPIKIESPGYTPDKEPSSAIDALEHAKAYWMMGWTWEEIASILEDMEFSPKTISNAVKKAQEYAEQVLEDGPFNIFREGQLVLLKNGSIGKITARYPDYLVLALGGEEVKIGSDKVALEETGKLVEAHSLRTSAHKLYREAQGGEDTYITERDKTMKVPKSPGGMEVRPEKEDKFETKLTERAPSGFGPITPKMSDVDEVTDLAAAALQDLDTLMEEYKSAEEENKTLNQMAKEIRGQMKGLEKSQTEVAQNIFAIIATQERALDDLDVTVFNKYRNKIIALQRKVEAKEIPVGPVDELNAVIEFLELNHPDIMADLLETLDHWKKQNTGIREVIKSTLAYYTPEKKKMGQSMTGLVNWVKNTWNNAKDFLENITSNILPNVEEGIAKMEALESTLDYDVTAKKVDDAMRVYMK